MPFRFGKNHQNNSFLNILRILIPKNAYPNKQILQHQSPNFVTANRLRCQLKHGFSKDFSKIPSLPLSNLKNFISSKAYFTCFLTNTLKESIFENLILLTRLLHLQSNVYFTLQAKRISHLCLLYRRIYSPSEFQNVFLENLLKKFKLFKLLDKGYHHFHITKHRWLFCFTAFCSAFKWDDNRIDEKEFDELVDDFLCSHQQYSTLKLNSDKTELGNTKKAQSNHLEQRTSKENNGDGNFMVVNCMQANNSTVVPEWEMLINRSNFSVWRKSVNNSPLYQYKVFGTFDDITAYSFYVVQKDLDYRKKWDKLVIKLDIIDKETESKSTTKKEKRTKRNRFIRDSENELVHWIMRYPVRFE